jgi:hypothetical protein
VVDGAVAITMADLGSIVRTTARPSTAVVWAMADTVMAAIVATGTRLRTIPVTATTVMVWDGRIRPATTRPIVPWSIRTPFTRPATTSLPCTATTPIMGTRGTQPTTPDITAADIRRTGMRVTQLPTTRPTATTRTRRMGHAAALGNDQPLVAFYA